LAPSDLLGRIRPRGLTIHPEFQFLRVGFPNVQCCLSIIEQKFDEKLEAVLSELEKMTELVEQPSKKRPSNQQEFIELLIEWIAVKSISFRLVNHQLFKEMVQQANHHFSVPVCNPLNLHVKRLADLLTITRALREKQLLFDGR
jgi:hypothetical protein